MVFICINDDDARMFQIYKNTHTHTHIHIHTEITFPTLGGGFINVPYVGLLALPSPSSLESRLELGVRKQHFHFANLLLFQKITYFPSDDDDDDDDEDNNDVGHIPRAPHLRQSIKLCMTLVNIQH